MSSIATTTGTRAPSYEQREKMLASVEKLIRSEVKLAKIPDTEREDVEQELRLVLWAQSEKFDPTRGSCFGS